MENQRKYLTERELKDLLRAITTPRDRAIFTISYWRGLRASEVGRLTISSFDAKAGRLHIRRLKHSLEGSFLLSPAELTSMRKWLAIRGTGPGPLFTSRQNRGIGRRMLDVLMRKYCKAAGIPPHLRHFHTLKHSIGTHLLGTLDVVDVQHWLGHRDIRSTMVYSQYRSQAADEAARRVYEAA